MAPILTTITPYWGRPEMLKTWLLALKGATHPQVRHLLILVSPSEDLLLPELPPNLSIEFCRGTPSHSICHYHNLGIELANTPWVMKMDVDTIPNVRFFPELLSVLETARSREWFNVGMIYLNRLASLGYFAPHRLPVSAAVYVDVMKSLPVISASPYRMPAGSNFVCRRRDYIEAMGGDPDHALRGFFGYGWEDYLQLYLLERHFLQRDPLPGWLDEKNVTQRCRDILSRAKAKDTWLRNPWLCLLHHWHPVARNTEYRDPAKMDANRRFLLSEILKFRKQ